MSTESFPLSSTEFIDLVEPIFNFFLKENVLSEKDYQVFFLAISYALIDMAKYCEQQQIKIVTIDRIQALVFVVPHLTQTLANFNIKKYIKSIFVLFKKIYIYNNKFDIKNLKEALQTCNDLILNDQIIAAFAYIKGFQESSKQVAHKKPYLYKYKATPKKINNALISIFDRTNIVDFAKILLNNEITIFATKGTAKYLKKHGIKVIDVDKYINSTETINGRVKTIDYKIYGGILARRDKDIKIMEEHNMLPIDLVVANLYPFQTVVAKPDCTLADAIENIDIGGTTMLRSAAKNHKWVSVVVDYNDYEKVAAEIDNGGNTSIKTRFILATKAFAYTAQYDGAISNYLGKKQDGLASTINLQFRKNKPLRYGENPHQSAAFYTETNKDSYIASANKLQGTEISYNNMVDADAALQCLYNFAKPTCVIVKHVNPCGVATADDALSAYLKAFKADCISAFGGVIAFNCEIDSKIIENIINNQFVVMIIAPKINKNAKNILATKPNLCVLECTSFKNEKSVLEYKSIAGGLLVQEKDLSIVAKSAIRYVSKLRPNSSQIKDLIFAWKVVKAVKSNAIVYARDEATIGIGAGQMSRVYSAKIAGMKAFDSKLSTKGAVMASDAFFPFADAIDIAYKDGIRAIIQPGGSINDDKIIKAADSYDMVMAFTDMRHFKH